MLLQLAGEMDGLSASSFQQDVILDKGIYAGRLRKPFITNDHVSLPGLQSIYLAPLQTTLPWRNQRCLILSPSENKLSKY